MPNEWPPRRPQQDPFDLNELWERLRASLPATERTSGWRVNPFLIAAIALLVWLATGIYTVAPDERGIVLRFGKVVRESEPGPHYALPWPIETVLRPSVTAIRKEEVGFRTVSQGPPARYQEVPVEALMLTGDENIVSLESIVQYRVRADASGPTDFLFNVRNPQDTVRAAAEAAMREVIGRTDIDQALTEGKEEIQLAAQTELQGILDRAYVRAYGHAARYLARLDEIAAGGAELHPLRSHEDFAAEIRRRHGRKPAFWAYVNGSRRDRHDEIDGDLPE